MIVVDSSAEVAVLSGEPEGARVNEALAASATSHAARLREVTERVLGQRPEPDPDREPQQRQRGRRHPDAR